MQTATSLQALCRQPRSPEGHQASARLQNVDLDLPQVSRRTRAQQSRRRNGCEARNHTGEFGPAAIRQEDRAGERPRIPDEAKASSAAMSAWIDSNRDTKRCRRGHKAAYKSTGSSAPQSAGPRSRKRKGADAAPSTPAHLNSAARTPPRIPYGNKDVAMKLGARYGSAGWYAPPGVDLSAFGERGWL